MDEKMRHFLLGILAGVGVALTVLVPKNYLLTEQNRVNHQLSEQNQQSIAQWKSLAEQCVARTEENSTVGTLLTESEPVAQPMSVLGGLLTIEPSFAGERAVPVWGISCKGEARLLGSPRPNHVYYWIDTKTRKIEGPFAPVVQPQ